jgi:hypothetical protein
MSTNKTFKSSSRFIYLLREIFTIIMVFLSLTVLSSCGNSDAESQIKKFCSQVKVGESIMNVVAHAGKVDFDKYWLEKFTEDPSKEDNIGILRPRDLEKKTEKFNKLKDPKTWNRGQFKAMIQELGYSRHVCTVDFAKDKVLKKKVLSKD